MKTVTFTHLGAKCEYSFQTKNLHITSKKSFNSPNQTGRQMISKKHNIKKQDIKSITFKYNDTQLPLHLYHYFSNYPNLESIELEKLDFKNVEAINGFIVNCPKLKEITITNKNAENLKSIAYFSVETENAKSITIKNVNAPKLQTINFLLASIIKDIGQITIEDITAPNIKTINNLIVRSTIKTLDLTKVGDVNVHTINRLISNCYELKTLKINRLTNTKKIGNFIEMTPLLETNIMSKINQIERLDTYFLMATPKNGALDLDKFKDISKLSSHLKESVSDKHITPPRYNTLKIGMHKITLKDYLTILTNNISILDKTEEEIIKEIITQSKSETKENIANFLETLENKKIFENEECKKELISKLTIIKNLK